MTATHSALLIAGPTASGKSALALHMAEALGGEIVNADSMQLYRGVRILTARPSAADEARVRHHLYGCAAPDDPWSVGRWLTAARDVMVRVHASRRLAIFVGGTGLYFDALERGLNAIPAIAEDIRTALRRRLEEDGLGALRRALKTADPDLAARIEPGDRQRTLRGLEVFEATGRPLSCWQRDTASAPILDGLKVARVLLMPEREGLYARCEARFDDMLEHGLLDEVAALKARNLAAGLPVMKALGVPRLIGHLGGACTLEEAITAAKTDTRRYAKRQMTWFRNRMAHWPVHQTVDGKCLVDTVASALDKPLDIPA